MRNREKNRELQIKWMHVYNVFWFFIRSPYLFSDFKFFLSHYSLWYVLFNKIKANKFN